MGLQARLDPGVQMALPRIKVFFGTLFCSYSFILRSFPVVSFTSVLP